jgi:hypothetical protein
MISGTFLAIFLVPVFFVVVIQIVARFTGKKSPTDKSDTGGIHHA